MEGRKVGLPTCLYAGRQERRKEGRSWGSGRTMKEEVKFNCNAFQIDLDDFNYPDPLSIYILMCIWVYPKRTTNTRRQADEFQPAVLLSSFSTTN